MSQPIWSELFDDDPIRQGDIIRCPAGNQDETWKFILTADCDIAQNKSGQHYTWLRIVTAQHWLEHYWAPEQLKKTAERQLRYALAQLNARIRRENASLAPLTSEALTLWLADATQDDVLTAIWGSSTPDPRAKLALLVIQTIHSNTSNAGLEKLKEVHRILGRPIEEFQASIREAFSGGGFPDFFFLPDLPGQDSQGFVVLLRDITSVPIEDVFQSPWHTKLAGRPGGSYRIGRMTDRLRFAISQKLAFLFSRIGLHREFETTCEDTAEVLSVMLGLAEE